MVNAVDLFFRIRKCDLLVISRDCSNMSILGSVARLPVQLIIPPPLYGNLSLLDALLIKLAVVLSLYRMILVPLLVSFFLRISRILIHVSVQTV